MAFRSLKFVIFVLFRSDTIFNLIKFSFGFVMNSGQSIETHDCLAAKIFRPRIFSGNNKNMAMIRAWSKHKILRCDKTLTMFNLLGFLFLVQENLKTPKVNLRMKPYCTISSHTAEIDVILTLKPSVGASFFTM